MAKVNIPGGSMVFHASGANTTYSMSAKATILSETIGIDVDGAAVGRVVQIDGSIEAKNFAVALEHFRPIPGHSLLLRNSSRIRPV